MRVSELERERKEEREREREGWRERWGGTETRSAVRKSNPTPVKGTTASPRTKGKHSRRPIVRNTQGLVKLFGKTRGCA